MQSIFQFDAKAKLQEIREKLAAKTANSAKNPDEQKSASEISNFSTISSAQMLEIPSSEPDSLVSDVEVETNEYTELESDMFFETDEDIEDYGLSSGEQEPDEQTLMEYFRDCDYPYEPCKSNPIGNSRQPFEEIDVP